jgi:hypothetical protein
MTYTINNKEFTQPKLSLFSIPALVALMKSVPTNITTTDEAVEVMGQVLPDAVTLVLRPLPTPDDIQSIDLETAVVIIEDFLALNNVEVVIDKFTTLFTRLKTLLDKVKSLFGVSVQ